MSKNGGEKRPCFGNFFFGKHGFTENTVFLNFSYFYFLTRVLFFSNRKNTDPLKTLNFPISFYQVFRTEIGRIPGYNKSNNYLTLFHQSSDTDTGFSIKIGPYTRL